MSISRWATDTHLVHQGPCKVHTLLVVADAGGPTTVTFYDGPTNDAEILTKLTTGSSTSLSVNFPYGRVCPEGVYAAVGANLEGFMIHYEPLT